MSSNATRVFISRSKALGCSRNRYAKTYLEQFASPTPPKDSPNRPNILFAIADDWGFGHAGAYGCKWVHETYAVPRLVVAAAATVSVALMASSILLFMRDVKQFIYFQF